MLENPNGQCGPKKHEGRVVARPCVRSAAEAQSLDELLVLLRLGRLEIVEESATLVDELHEAAARCVIALVGREVLTQTIDTFGQERDLHFGGASVLRPAAVLRDDPAFFLSG